MRPFKTGSDLVPASDYDLGDAFFLPMSHLEAIGRPGPDFYLYARGSN